MCSARLTRYTPAVVAMAGRPPLRIGAHGKISRVHLGEGVWLARCRYRDSDGVTRIVERRGPADESDKHGKLAEDALIEALAKRRPPAGSEVSLDTRIGVLVDRHIERLGEDGRSPVTLAAYRYAADKLTRFIGGIRVGDATPHRLDAAVRSMRTAHGPVMARRARTVLSGALRLAVMGGVLGANPVRDLAPIKSKGRPKGAPALTACQLRELLDRIESSECCRRHDLADPITVLAATGLRRSEVLGLRWLDFDETAGTLTVSGKVIRVAGEGLVRVDDTKSAAGRRTVPLPRFAVAALTDRRSRPYVGQHAMIFASTTGTLRDPDNFLKRWRAVRADLGVPDVTTHSFRKTIATLIDAEGLSARVGADHLGHAKVSMTQDVYMSRGRVHAEVANLMDRAINDE